MSEKNPNHPVTQQVHDQWHKLCALLLFKYGKTKVIITPEEVTRAFAADLNITVRFSDDVGVELTLVDSDEADRLARQEGGLPV